MRTQSALILAMLLSACQSSEEADEADTARSQPPSPAMTEIDSLGRFVERLSETEPPAARSRTRR